MCVFKTIMPFTILKTASQIREFFCISAQSMPLFLIWKQELAWVSEFPRAVALEQSKTCLRWHAECNTDTSTSQWTGQTLGSVLGKDGQGQKQKGPTEVSSGSCKEQNSVAGGRKRPKSCSVNDQSSPVRKQFFQDCFSSYPWNGLVNT